MTIPLFFELISNKTNLNVFITSTLITLFVGLSLTIAFKNEKKIVNIKDTLVVTSFSLPILCIFASLPFFIGSQVETYADAFFEATSGLTTTGATIFDNVESLSSGFLIWRSLLQWIGGLGIIIFAIAILPILNLGGMQLFTQDWNEKSEDLHYRSKELAKILGGIYLLFTFLIFIMLWFFGLSFFDALCHSMTTVATGGFSTRSSSIGSYNNLGVELTIVLGMILASLPFTLFISSIKNKLIFFEDKQVITFLMFIVFFTLIIAVWLHFENNIGIFTAIRLAVFNGVSLMTGTGYSTSNFSDWGSFSTSILLLMMLIGGCTGSTTGGLKVFRIQILFYSIIKEIRKINSPRSVFTISYKNKLIDHGIFNSVILMIILFISGVLFVSIVFSLHGYDFLTSVSAGITSIAVVGPGLGNIIGPEESFSTLPSKLKIVLSTAMIIGRLEFLTFLILLTPKFWLQK